MLALSLVQISTMQVDPDIHLLYERCKKGCSTATVDDMAETLFMILHKRRRIYLIVDALDECSERPLLLQVIEQILHVDIDIHLLLTSREEYDIQMTLEPCIAVLVSMEDKHVDPDIQQCLHSDPKLCKWG